jgi:aryl-alcohol dehydrogenase-like predicted oxidoreductase
LNDTSLETLLPFLQQKNIGVISAAPLAMGLLTERGAPEWHPAPPEIKDACARAAAHCKARGSDIAKLAMQYSVSNPAIATTLVGASEAAMIEKNARWIEEPIDEELLAEVLAIFAPIRNRTWPSGRAENGDG